MPTIKRYSRRVAVALEAPEDEEACASPVLPSEIVKAVVTTPSKTSGVAALIYYQNDIDPRRARPRHSDVHDRPGQQEDHNGDEPASHG
jgi:hypothetical protein